MNMFRYFKVCFITKCVICNAAFHSKSSIARAFLERYEGGTEFRQRSSPRTKWERNRKPGRCLSIVPLTPALF